MSEQVLRAAFARHEDLVPPAEPLRERIDAAAKRTRRRHIRLRASGVAVLTALAIVTPFALRAEPAVIQQSQLGGISPAPSGPLNLLLLGLDSRPGVPTTTAHADTILLVHVPATRDRAYVISFERDTRIDIPGFAPAKINAAFTFGAKQGGVPGGFRLTAQALQQLTGVTFDAGIVIDFAGLARVTDTLGGVNLCVDQKVTSVQTHRTFEPGCQRFDGATAVDYVRQRLSLPNGAYDRDRHVIAFLKALFAAASAERVTKDPVALDRLLRAAGEALVIDPGALSTVQWVQAVSGVRDLIGIANPAKDGGIVGGEAWQVLDNPAASDLYTALRADSVDQWLVAHPQAVS